MMSIDTAVTSVCPWKKRKIAVTLGYNGKDYKGTQFDETRKVDTIDRQVHDALAR